MPEPVFPTSSDSLTGWGLALQAAVCERCNWRYLLLPAPQGKAPLCPHCFQAPVVFTGAALEDMPHAAAPELVAPFGLSEARMQEIVQNFAKDIPYAPRDLAFPAMRARLKPVYLPMWLVDGSAQAYWEAEAGFNYEVVSHQEHYADAGRGWQSRQVREPRIRWEKRVGRLKRIYQNISAPALEDTPAIRQQLGDYKLNELQPYHPRLIERACVRLPDRSTQDAWSDAAAGFQSWASGEVQKACASDHLRQFRWKAQFDQLNWSLLLLPAYTTYYLDDEGRPQPVLIHGQTGRVIGKRRASMQRAQRASLILLIVGLALSLLGLLFGGLGMAGLGPAAASLALLGLLAGILVLLGAMVPIGIAWDFNRR